MQTTTIPVGGMTCGGCAGNVIKALNAVDGVETAQADHVAANATITHSDEVSEGEIEAAITNAGYSVGGTTAIGIAGDSIVVSSSMDDFNWKDGEVWRKSAHNTKWCLIGCSIGEFGTLAYYTYSGVTDGLVMWSGIWLFYLLLPLINGLITSVMLETVILLRDQMDFKNALSTALGMSFISMLMMEIAMLITDLLFTKGDVGIMPIAIPFMLIVGFLTPWPYNYWRLKKYGMACH